MPQNHIYNSDELKLMEQSNNSLKSKDAKL